MEAGHSAYAFRGEQFIFYRVQSSPVRGASVFAEDDIPPFPVAGAMNADAAVPVVDNGNPGKPIIAASANHPGVRPRLAAQIGDIFEQFDFGSGPRPFYIIV
jgi:hypothetical protein